MRPHDWISLGSTLAALGTVIALVAGEPLWVAAAATVALAGGLVARAASQRRPGPMPHALRWTLLLPRGPLSAAKLLAILEPRPGERILEVGPGIGVYSIPVASAVAPRGTLEALDVQPEMLADLKRRVAKAGVTNVVATEGDALHLPYADRSFDAAFLVGVLGEIPDPPAALREVRRVLEPGGRLIAGETLAFDPDAVRLAPLCELAAAAGFVFEKRSGPRVAYFARFRSTA